MNGAARAFYTCPDAAAQVSGEARPPLRPVGYIETRERCESDPAAWRTNVGGFVRGELMLDLAYAEDSIADADVNVVATSEGQLIEVQGTAEGRPFSKEDFDRVFDLALRGIAQLVEAQRAALE